jgi:hypothetical protein
MNKMDGNNVPQSRFIELLLRAENRILRHLEDAELNHGFGGNFDLLLRLWIDPGASFPLLFYELPKSRHDEFAVLFGGFVGDGAERIKEYAGGLFIGLRGCGKCALKFCLGHLEEGFRGASSHENRTASTKSSFILACMERRPNQSPARLPNPAAVGAIARMQWPRVNPISHQPAINHRRANDGGDDGDGSSRCHSNNLDSWRGDNKRAGSSNTNTRDRSSRHCNSPARNIPVPHPR